MKTRELLAKNQQADFLAPFLVRFEDKKPQKEEVDVAIQDCLRDFKKNYADMENELQRRYDETTAELNSLKRFLHRYMDQFSVQEYEKFILEGWVRLWIDIGKVGDWLQGDLKITENSIHPLVLDKFF